MTTSPDNSWLDLGPGPGNVQATKSLVSESKRGKAVNMTLAGKGRTWHCDGKYIWFRRKKANPATLQRLNDHIARGEIKFIVTSDDVEMYEVAPTSPFHRREAQDLTKLNLSSIQWIAIRAAKKGDWAEFVDSLGEMASRVKGRVYSDGHPADSNFAKLLWGEFLTRFFANMRMAGGPSQETIDREVAALRQRRGEGNGSRVILPPESGIARV